MNHFNRVWRDTLYFNEFKSKIRFIRCEICGGDPKVIVLLPKRQHDGKLDTLACESCSAESGMYYQKHQRPHLGFEDETTACLFCIEEILKKDGERIAGMFAAAVSQSEKAPEIKQAIEDWLEEINSMLKTPHALNVTWAIITYAQRMKRAPEEVIERVAKEGAEVILPHI